MGTEVDTMGTAKSRGGIDDIENLDDGISTIHFAEVCGQ